MFHQYKITKKHVQNKKKKFEPKSSNPLIVKGEEPLLKNTVVNVAGDLFCGMNAGSINTLKSSS